MIYRPETERVSHYFQARLANQFDAVVHFDRTQGVRPLERWPVLEAPEPPETYPTGLKTDFFLRSKRLTAPAGRRNRAPIPCSQT